MPTRSERYSLPTRPVRPSILRQIRNYFALARQRRGLRALEPHLLDDIGITRDQAKAEADKPVWDVPRHWRM